MMQAIALKMPIQNKKWFRFVPGTAPPKLDWPVVVTVPPIVGVVSLDDRLPLAMALIEQWNRLNVLTMVLSE
jgi:hypothetical protein